MSSRLRDSNAGRIGAARPRSRFAEQLDERHGRRPFDTADHWLELRPTDPWIDPENVLGLDGAAGFVDPLAAADRLGISLDELDWLIADGLLEGRHVGGRLRVRPSLVHRIGVVVD